jgi:hypothetical protein
VSELAFKVGWPKAGTCQHDRVRFALNARIANALALTIGVIGVPNLAVQATAAAPDQHCRAGARTLSTPGSRVYPDVGNGGYRSVHTDVHMVYDSGRNRFLPGNHVVLHDRATQCLTSFSVDFERHSSNTAAGPDMRIRSVTVDGNRASWRFVRPTYPGDPKGPDDPDPRAHQASQLDQVGGKQHNPLPPACSPELSGNVPANSRNGTMCPANKLVISPSAPIRKGATFRVRIAYTGRPGVHNDGDGTTEGWFRASDGGFVTTEPLGTEDWMPLNDHPTAKPTYDFYDTVEAGRTAVCNGILVGSTTHKASRQYPNGSTTWHWHAPMNIASYLVENSVGDYTISRRTADNGTYYYDVQDRAINPAEQAVNDRFIGMQQDITEYEALFNGPFPFRSDGVIVGTPSASFEEEMQTMITFEGGMTDPITLYHENMHQWWGDHVTEGSFAMTFFKEGMATLSEALFTARTAETAAGGPSSSSGQAAFERSLKQTFVNDYNSGGSFWTQAPADPTAATLFSTDATYNRPAAAYIAVRQILGHAHFVDALRAIQSSYGGRSITEAQLEASFGRWLPDRSTGCERRLTAFFGQWFDTAYRPGGGSDRPTITGPGLPGTNFYGHGGCRRP